MNIKTSPLWQWILLLLASFVLATVGYGLVVFTGEMLPVWWSTVVASLLFLALYCVFVRSVEKEWAPDILSRKGPAHLLLGLVIGLLFFVLVVGIMWLTGFCRLEWVGADGRSQLNAFALFFGVAVGEEVMFRGVLFKWIDKRWGLTAALAVSALIFGFIHITNDYATWWSGLAIAIEAGLLLGAAYKYSGTLWLPIGIHWAWNYSQGNVFGFAVSGNDAGTTLMKVVTEGPDLITGGAFGAETSLVSVVLGAALAALFLALFLRKTRLAG